METYNTYEDVKKVCDDGYIAVKDTNLKTADFKSEAALSEYINNNIEAFCSELGDVYISHTVDQVINKRNWLAPRGRRADLVIDCENNLFIVELKNPRSGTENRAAIGQILDYGREFPDTKKKQLVIVTTWFDINTARTIKHYHLPIRYFHMSKLQLMEFIGEQ